MNTTAAMYATAETPRSSAATIRTHGMMGRGPPTTPGEHADGDDPDLDAEQRSGEQHPGEVCEHYFPSCAFTYSPTRIAAG